MVYSNPQVQLGNAAEIIMGQSPKGETYNRLGDGVPLLNGPTEFGPSYPIPALWTTAPTKICKEGDILFCVRGSTTGRMNWADREYCLGRGIGAFRGKDSQSDTRFLWYSLINELPRLLALCSGSVFSNLSRQDFEQFPINWPDDNTRAAIASILGALDDKIELNRKMNETLEAMARAIFKSWFVDFEPIPGIGPHKGWQDSPLGKIPRGWRVGTLSEICGNHRRGVKPEDTKPGTPYIGLEHLPRKNIALSEWGFADSVVSNKFSFKKGEILFGKLRPYFHKVGVAAIDGVCSTDILVINSKTLEWYGFAISHLSSDDFVNYADGTSSGTKMPRTNWNDMARYQLVIPQETIAGKFTDTILSMIQTIQSNIHQSRTLSSTRDALLPKLLAGEIRVKDVEKITGTV